MQGLFDNYVANNMFGENLIFLSAPRAKFPSGHGGVADDKKIPLWLEGWRVEPAGVSHKTFILHRVCFYDTILMLVGVPLAGCQNP